MLDGDAAGGVHRGGRLFEAPPLCRFLCVPFLFGTRKEHPTVLRVFKKIEMQILANLARIAIDK